MGRSGEKEFVKPELEILWFCYEDVILTSLSNSGVSPEIGGEGEHFLWW